jgi:tetratricopeptide (TPR) repeat protein
MQKILFKKVILFLATSVLAVGLHSYAFAHEVNKSAIVLLTCKDKAGEMISTGTGFIVKPDGTLITNYHVLVDAVSVNAVFQNGSQVPVRQVLKVDRIKDFAVLKLRQGLYSTLEIGDSRKIRAYDYSSALGYLSQSVSEEEGNFKGELLQTFGFVLGIHPQAHPDFPYIYNTTAFSPGFSGGPLVDKENKVIGIATLEGRGINLALPIHEVEPFLDQKTGMTLDQLFQEDRSSKEALYYRGNFSLYGKGDLDEAVLNFQEVLKKDPNFVLALYDLAAAKRNQGLIDETIADYEKILKINPHFPEALSNLGGYYFRAGKLEKAAALFEQAVQNYPNFIQALSNLGAALNKLDRASDAVPHLQKTIRLDPEFAIAYYNLGNSYFSLNRLEEAQKTYGKSVELGLDFLSLHWKLYETNNRLGKNLEAKKQLEIILQMDPENQKAQQALAKLSPAAVK